jgi:4-amino-4-deoxy-L-arabinose transferase-like glycosyltransferase
VIRLRRLPLPLPLLVILVVVLVEGLAWTYAVPALQGADEGSHFFYVQKIVDGHEIPWSRNQGMTVDSDLPASVSGEQRLAWTWAGLEQLRGNLSARPLWTHEDERIWAAQAAKLTPADKRDGIGSQVKLNPPLYYLTAAIPYAIAGGSFFDRLYALRLYDLLLLLVAVGVTWLLAGELFARRRELQTVATAAVGLQPVLLGTMTAVTPDALLMVWAALALYLAVRLVRGGWSWRLVGLLVLVVVLALFTQGRAAGLVFLALFAVGLVGWRRWGPAWRPSRAVSAVAWAVGSVIVLLVAAFYATGYRLGQITGFWSYLWQFYLPRLPGMEPPTGTHWTATNVYIDRFFGSVSGQFEVSFPADLLSWIKRLVLLGLIGLVVAAWRHRTALRERRDVVVMLLVALILEVLTLHMAAFRSLLDNPADPVITGRYLFMLIPLYGLGVAGALSALTGRLRAVTTGGLLAFGVLLQIGAFGLVVERFYA